MLSRSWAGLVCFIHLYFEQKIWYKITIQWQCIKPPVIYLWSHGSARNGISCTLRGCSRSSMCPSWSAFCASSASPAELNSVLMCCALSLCHCHQQKSLRVHSCHFMMGIPCCALIQHWGNCQFALETCTAPVCRAGGLPEGIQKDYRLRFGTFNSSYSVSYQVKDTILSPSPNGMKNGIRSQLFLSVISWGSSVTRSAAPSMTPSASSEGKIEKTLQKGAGTGVVLTWISLWDCS